MLIADAPCHGKQFHDGVLDNFPDLDKCKEADIRPQLDRMISRNINLIQLEISKSTSKMAAEIENYYEERDYDEMF